MTKVSKRGISLLLDQGTVVSSRKEVDLSPSSVVINVVKWVILREIVERV